MRLTRRPAETSGMSLIERMREADWPGRHLGRRLTCLPPVPRPAVPLYTLGTAARIERIRLLYLRGDFPSRGRDPLDAAWWVTLPVR